MTAQVRRPAQFLSVVGHVEISREKRENAEGLWAVSQDSSNRATMGTPNMEPK